MVTLRSRMRRLGDELVKFGLVGALGFLVDVSVFNLLRYDGGGWNAPLDEKPITAKVVSVCVATLVTYVGNRSWTWRHGSRRETSREVVTYYVLNGVGMLIAVLCLAISHYVLGYTSVLADNVAANGVGLVLGTAFRFWSYRRFVFPLGGASRTGGR